MIKIQAGIGISCWRNCSPLIPGISMSINKASGGDAVAAFNASEGLEKVPVICMNGYGSRKATVVSKSTLSSSTTIQVIVFFMVVHQLFTSFADPSLPTPTPTSRFGKKADETNFYTPGDPAHIHRPAHPQPPDSPSPRSAGRPPPPSHRKIHPLTPAHGFPLGFTAGAGCAKLIFKLCNCRMIPSADCRSC